MSNRAIIGVAVVGLVATLSVTAGSADAYWRPGTTERISVSSSGAQANDDSPNPQDGISPIAMTPDGRFVAFASKATNLAPSGVTSTTLITQQVFVRDRLRHTTTLVSVPSGLTAGIGAADVCQYADSPAISDNGRYVAFGSTCTNLVPGHPDLNLASDVFVRDLHTGTTTLVSVSTSGATGNGGSTLPTISADGRYVGFQSSATDLVQSTCASDAYAQAMCAAGTVAVITGTQVYVRDLARQKTVLASAATDGGRGNGNSSEPAMSPDGRYLAFSSIANDLVAGDTNVCNPAYGAPSCPDVFLRDLQTGHTELISVGLGGQPGDDASGWLAQHQPQAISGDDRYVVFFSYAKNLVPNYLGAFGIYVRDRKTGRTERVTVDNTGKPNEAETFSISRDGRYVGLSSMTSLVTCGATGPSPGLAAVHDRVTGGLDVVGWTTYTGQQNTCAKYYNVYQPQVSRFGRYVSFITTADNLVRGDTNKKSDVFVRDRGLALGTGGLARSGSLTFAGAATFGATGVAEAADATGDVDAVLSDLGLDLRAATVAYRPATSDLFVRLELDHMPLFALASDAVVYTLDLTARGTRYEVRMSKTGFALFRADDAGWTHVADVRGGYGTTGEEVVAAVPLAMLGATDGGRLTDVRASSGFGSVTTGVLNPIDGVTL